MLPSSVTTSRRLIAAPRVREHTKFWLQLGSSKQEFTISDMGL